MKSNSYILRHLSLFGLLLFSLPIFASGFEVITLGNKGGIQDGNLTAFMIKAKEDDNYVTLDAGSVVNGLIEADKKANFSHITPPDDSPYSKIGYILKNKIRGYLISHAHLDHIAGLIIASPDDSKKPIYALASTNANISQNYFNWSAWPNFGDRGEGLKLSQYQYIDLPEKTFQPINQTKLEVKAFPLSHSGHQSTAFLLKNTQDEYFIYFGDTGADSVEKSNALEQIWLELGELVKNKALKGMVIEVSFTNDTPDKMLFGHLTPKLLIEELTKLESMNGKGSLTGLDIVVSHIKYSLKKGEDPQVTIKRELNEINTLGVNFLFPEQGDLLVFE